MCELFGIISAESYEINNELKEFFPTVTIILMAGALPAWKQIMFI